MNNQEICIHFTCPSDEWEYHITTQLKEDESLADFLQLYFDDFIIFDTENPEYEVMVPDSGFEVLTYITEITDVAGLPTINTDLFSFFGFEWPDDSDPGPFGDGSIWSGDDQNDDDS